MTPNQKDQLLAEAKAHISATTSTISDLVAKFDTTLKAGPGTFYTSESDTAFEDEMRAMAAATNTGYIREQMADLAESPYFARCDLRFDDEAERPYYFGKYSASELGIYSWTSAIAALRFEAPGAVSYRTPTGEVRDGTLARRDQYMIARRHLNFMTTELAGSERELIYQEHFTSRKHGFVLPEVVAQMEQAQDRVVRAHHAGPFVISGPAGSGKTTLALHRVAYLRQSPETTELYPANSILVLVQDAGTDEYFSHLLPELGIHDVAITTFSHWAIGVLGIGHMFYHARPGRTEVERDAYEYAKVQALRGTLPHVTRAEIKAPAKILKAHYRGYLSEAQQALLADELEEGAIDRYDLTLLLMLQRQLEGALTVTREVQVRVGPKRIKRSFKTEPLNYSLVLLDEYQNYLPEQLTLLRGTSGERGSMLYVGDAAQKTQFGALEDLAAAGEQVPSERMISLEKVYRNTRQILEYIGGLGYTVEIPTGVGDGPAVHEHSTIDIVEDLRIIQSLTRSPGTQLGIIAKDPATLETYRDFFQSDSTITCLTMREAQGVEFDTVCIVGVTPSTFATDSENPALADEQHRIHRDLLYVALTRAIHELHVIGEIGLGEALGRAKA